MTSSHETTGELLRQVQLLNPAAQIDDAAAALAHRPVDVWIESGQIQAIAPTLPLPDGAVERDCHGLILGPGLIDLYSSGGEPGFEARETLESLGRTAAAGGFTRLAMLPTTHPAIDHPAMVTWVRDRYQQVRSRHPWPQLLLWGALTHNAAGEKMTEFAELAASGIVGFTDGRALDHPQLLRRSLEYLRPVGLPIALWPCSRELSGHGVMREGVDALRFGLPAVPVMAETTALTTILEAVETTQTPVHLMRISTARSVALIRQAKARGLPITASVHWLHLLRHTQDLETYNPNLRLNPPLGTPADQAALIAGVQAGVLDAIAIDHRAYTYEEKTVAFAEAPSGTVGLGFALPLLWQGLVSSQLLSPLQLWSALSLGPARCLGQTLGAIAPQQPAELTLFDPNAAWSVTPETDPAPDHNLPWLQSDIQGRVLKIWVTR